METMIRSVEHDYKKGCEVLYAIKGLYPFIGLGAIGKSVLGREIYAVTIGKGDSPVLFAGAFHGTERLTALVLLRFIEQLCHAIQNNLAFAGVNARKAIVGGIIVVPLVNPDGCEIALKGAAGAGTSAAAVKRLCSSDFHLWNANARGVDINHNFNAGWEILRDMEREAGIYGPAPRQYGGPSPESEPETVALTTFCRQHKIRHALAFHSQGEEIYWHYGDHTPERSKKMARIFTASSGYAMEEPTGLASHGGFKDWFIEEFGRPGFTFEIGRGKNPLDPSLLNAVYARLEETLILATLI